MKSALLPIASLMLSAAILLMGNGLQTTLLSLRADLEGFDLTAVGLLLSFYYVGFILGCSTAPRFIRNVGHIRAFTAFASIASAAALLHVLMVNSWLWLPLRVITGFCFAALHMIIDSWINEKASNENRGKILAVYRFVDLVAIIGGQLLLVLASPASFALFAITSILISLALVPVALSTSSGPQPIKSAKLNLPKLYKLSPLAVIGVLTVGASNSAFWSIAPVYVQRLGFDVSVVAVFMTVAIMGGALVQVPLAMFSDQFDRRKTLVVLSFLAFCAGMGLFYFGDAGQGALLSAAFFYGFTALPLYGLCVAHANDHVEDGEFVETNGGLLLLFGLAAMVGPILAPQLITLFGPNALFAYTAAVNLSLVFFGIWRIMQRDPVEQTMDETFMPSPRIATAGVIAELDQDENISPHAPSKG